MDRRQTWNTTGPGDRLAGTMATRGPRQTGGHRPETQDRETDQEHPGPGDRGPGQDPGGQENGTRTVRQTRSGQAGNHRKPRTGDRTRHNGPERPGGPGRKITQETDQDRETETGPRKWTRKPGPDRRQTQEGNPGDQETGPGQTRRKITRNPGPVETDQEDRPTQDTQDRKITQERPGHTQTDPGGPGREGRMDKETRANGPETGQQEPGPDRRRK
ncbi:protein piccolo-like [Haliotis rubra]|uniref:protein piccolo-like n=1 Tax=Haliotis rubra TaxID=36100 RepID=UPI001EE5C7B2|nr:protein piccolo-like [Haliotis rubra]